MKTFIILFLATLLSVTHAAEAARGFGPTSGVSITDDIQTINTITLPSRHTVSFWFYANTATNNSGPRLFATNSSTNIAQLFFTTSGTLLALELNFSGQIGIWEVTPPSLNAWHTFAYTYDGTSVSNKPIIYLDGSPVSVTVFQAPTGTYNVGPNTYSIGANNTASKNFDGKMAQFVIWNVILNANEVMALAKGASPARIEAAARITHYPLTGISATEINLVGGAGNATPTGTKFQPDPPTSPFPFQGNSGL